MNYVTNRRSCFSKNNNSGSPPSHLDTFLSLTFLRGKVVRSLNSSNGYPLEATKSKRTWSLQLPRKRLSKNSPLGVRILNLLICSPDSSSGSAGRACSNDKRIAWGKQNKTKKTNTFYTQKSLHDGVGEIHLSSCAMTSFLFYFAFLSYTMVSNWSY